jgi:hypothetical protein
MKTSYVPERKRDFMTYTRYLYTNDLSLSEEACLAGDRGPPRVFKALGLVLLKEGEASGLPHDLHHQQRREGEDKGAEPEERGGVPQVLERRLSSPPGLMKIFKLRLSPITAVS